MARSHLADETPSGAEAHHVLRQTCLSVVVPARNEAESLTQLVSEVVDACREQCSRHVAGPAARLGAFELIVVDDASTDATPRVLDELRGIVPELRPLRLEAQVGQSGALMAGIHAAIGDWIATLDADLQNDPADLMTLWEALDDNDVALGWRLKRRDKWSRRLISRLANRVRNAVLGQSIRDTGCSVRIFRREHALRLPLFQGMHRFLGPLLLRQGCRLVQMPVNHRPRAHGRSHYNVWNRSIRVVVDLLGVAWLMRRPIRYRIVEVATVRSHDPAYQAHPSVMGS